MKRSKHSTRRNLREYLQRKQRNLSRKETEQIKGRLNRGQANVYQLAEEFGCVPTQIAGIKAWRRRK